MTGLTRFSQRIPVLVVTLALAVGTALVQPDVTSAGFGSSPGAPRIAKKCTSGTHIPEVAAVQRKAGEGQKDFA